MKTMITISLSLFLIAMCAASSARPKYQKATFAGGCFWYMEEPFESIRGVIEVIAGYAGGDKENPTIATLQKIYF